MTKLQPGIGERIRHRRNELVARPWEIADAAGIYETRYNNIEAGNTTPTVDEALNIAHALGWEITDLIPDGHRKPSRGNRIRQPHEVFDVIVKQRPRNIWLLRTRDRKIAEKISIEYQMRGMNTEIERV